MTEANRSFRNKMNPEEQHLVCIRFECKNIRRMTSYKQNLDASTSHSRLNLKTLPS